MKEDKPESEPIDLVLTRKSTRLPALVYLGPEAEVAEVMKVLSEHSITQLPILEGNSSIGKITEAGLTRRILEDPGVLRQPVKDIMEEAMPVIEADSRVEEVMQLLRERETPAVLVRRHQVLTGIVSRSDLIEYLSHH